MTLAMEPKIMLFDELTSALDPEMAGEVRVVMKEEQLFRNPVQERTQSFLSKVL